jgi:hypothetical protein
MSAFYRDCGLQRGDKFAIRVDGGCSNVDPPVDWYLDPPIERTLEYSKREVVTEPIDISETASELRDPFGDASLTFVALDLHELKPGEYQISVNFDGIADRLSVADNSGEEYAA